MFNHTIQKPDKRNTNKKEIIQQYINKAEKRKIRKKKKNPADIYEETIPRSHPINEVILLRS